MILSGAGHHRSALIRRGLCLGETAAVALARKSPPARVRLISVEPVVYPRTQALVNRGLGRARLKQDGPPIDFTEASTSRKPVILPLHFRLRVTLLLHSLLSAKVSLKLVVSV